MLFKHPNVRIDIVHTDFEKPETIVAARRALKGTSLNAISPGIILTPHHVERIQKKAVANGIPYQDQLAKESEGTALKRLGQPADVAHLTRFLLSQKARHIIGSNVVLDGGASAAY